MSSRLDDAKEGDEVYVYLWSDHLPHSEIITRTTKTQVTIAGQAYLRSNGKPVGDARWLRGFARMATPEVRAEVEAEKAERAIQERIAAARKVFRVTKENIDRIEAIIAETSGPISGEAP